MAENTDNSIITLARRIKTCRASSGAAPKLPPITHIALGDGGVDADGKPIPPTETQTALHNEIARYPVEAVTYPEQTTARYSITVPKPDLPGKFISEAAMVDEEGDLSGIKTMLAKGKDEGTSMTFELDDKF